MSISNGDTGLSARTAINTAIGKADTAAQPGSAQTWTASQAFTSGMTGGTDTVASSGGVQTVQLDGRAHVITLSAACTITLSAVGTGYSSAIIVLIQDPTTPRTISWAGTPKALDTQTISTTAGKHTVWLAWTPNGGTTYYLSGAGKEA